MTTTYVTLGSACVDYLVNVACSMRKLADTIRNIEEKTTEGGTEE